jgi:cell division protein FtsB
MREKRIKRRKLIRRLIVYSLLSLLIIGVLLYIFVWGNFGFLKIKDLEKEKEDIVKEIDQLKDENEKLESTLKDPTSIEKIAEEKEREEKGYIREDEVLFKFINKDEDNNTETD